MKEEYLIGIKKRVCEFVLLITIVFFMELVFNLIIFHSFISYFLLEATLIVILAIPMLIMKHNIAANIYAFIIFALVSTFFIVNLEMYYASSDIFTFKYLTLTGEAAAVMSIDFINFWYIAILLLFVITFIGGLILINIIFKGGEYNPRRGITISILALLILIPTRMITYEVIEHDYSNNYLYYNESGQEIVIKSATVIKRASLKNFGLLNYTYADLQAQLVDITTFGDVSEEEHAETEKTSMTGAAKGYNVLEIMIETGMSIGVNETLTPNLYNLRKNGINFTNNHSKNKTNISEFIGISGSVTSTIKNIKTNAPQSLPSVLGNVFGYDTSYFHCNYASFYNRGTTMPQIGFNHSYFVGSDKYKVLKYDESVEYMATDMEWNNNFNGRYPYDSNYVDVMKDKMIPEGDRPFYSFYTSLTTHGPYNFKKSLEDYYKEKYDIINEAIGNRLWTNPCYDDAETVQDQFIEYECKLMIFDDALGILLDDLIEKGKLDNTLIVLYGDHEAYYKIGLPRDLKYFIYDSNSEYYAPEYETFMTIYNPNVIEKLKECYSEFDGFSLNSNNELIYSAFTSPYVIVPTILDLLGIKYIKGNYVGRSIFGQMETKSLIDNAFYSSELGLLFTNKLTSDGESTFWRDDTIDSEYDNEFYSYIYKTLSRIAKFDSYYLYGHYNDNKVVEETLATYSYFEE